MAVRSHRSLPTASEFRAHERASEMNELVEMDGACTRSCSQPNLSRNHGEDMKQLFRKTALSIWRNPSLSFADKQRQIQQLHLSATCTKTECLEVGAFPGRSATHCSHYERKCWLKADCCQRYYPCRRCHDETESHGIDRHATKFVGCIACGASEQPVGPTCTNCGVLFAAYYCEVCRFYDDTPGRSIYHCSECGICRVGKGLGIDNHHCHGCNACIPIDVADSHPCMERSMECNCPICSQFMASSTDPVVIMQCGHAMHAACFSQYTTNRYTCPICCKSLTNMEAWYRLLDKRLDEEGHLPEFAMKRTRVYCHDCEVESNARYHFQFHKCQQCAGYNTRVVKHFDIDPSSDAFDPVVDSNMSPDLAQNSKEEAENDAKTNDSQNRDTEDDGLRNRSRSDADKTSCDVKRKRRDGVLGNDVLDHAQAEHGDGDVRCFADLGLLGSHVID